MNAQVPGKPKATAVHVRLFVLAAISALAMALVAPALAAADWGAIAVNPRTGKVGVSYDYPTAQRAKKRARHECHQRGCRVAVWVRNQYAALVLKRNGVFVAGVGTTKHRAFHKARERAHESSAKKYAWTFSGY
jgi:hypothetical protein